MKKVLMLTIILIIIMTPACQTRTELNVPIIKNLGMTCFQSSVTMVMKYWGKDVTLQEVIDVVGSRAWSYEHPELHDLVRKYNLKYEYITDATMDDIKKFLKMGIPVIPHQTASETNKAGHATVIIGFDDEKQEFRINDPDYDQTQTISYETFQKLWDEITDFEPGPKNKLWVIYPI